MIVTDTVDGGDRVWIDTRDPRVRGSHCAIAVVRTPEALVVSKGDEIWWRGSATFWTPLDRQGRPLGHRIALTRIGGTNLPYPVEAVLGFKTAPVFEVGLSRYQVGVDWATEERSAWVLSMRNLPWYLTEWGASADSPRFGDLDQAHRFPSRQEAQLAALDLYSITRGRCLVMPLRVRVRLRHGSRTIELS